jgi:hypothetical protein
MGSLQRSENTGDETRGGDGRGNTEPAPPVHHEGWMVSGQETVFLVGSVAFVLLPAY